MALLDAETSTRRARTAWVYSGLEQRELAKRSGIRIATLRRILSPADARGANADERQAIAEACAVPVWFMEGGFDTADVLQGRFDERLGAVERSIRALLKPETPPDSVDDAMQPAEAGVAAASQASSQKKQTPARRSSRRAGSRQQRA